MLKNHIYAAIDLKSFYASVECIERGLDPLKNNLVVADNSRTDKTICLAVSPALKAYDPLWIRFPCTSYSSIPFFLRRLRQSPGAEAPSGYTPGRKDPPSPERSGSAPDHRIPSSPGGRRRRGW